MIFYHGWGMKCLKVATAFFGWSQNTYLRMPIAHGRPCVGVVRLQVTADEVCHLSLFCDDAKARKVLTSGNLLKAHIFDDHFLFKISLNNVNNNYLTDSTALCKSFVAMFTLNNVLYYPQICL